jgi:antitoxin ParD1/3/4
MMMDRSNHLNIRDRLSSATPTIARTVRFLVLNTGRYVNAEEVLEIALQLLARLDIEYQVWIEETRQQIAIGIAELDRGEGIDGATVMEGYLQKFMFCV